MNIKYPIKQIALEIYGGCNYRCTMCPQDGGRHSDFLKKLPFEVFEKIIKDSVSHGCEVVSLHGSGEATLHPRISDFVRIVKNYGMKCITVSNGYLLDEGLSRSLIEAGLDYIRISGIGYDRESYKKWMKKDAFDLVRSNVKNLVELRSQAHSEMRVGLYHLIFDSDNQEREIQLYRKNWIDYCGEVEAEIWKMHNWAGSYDTIRFPRSSATQRSCGRPYSPYLNVRAGGLDGAVASVVPCCFVLGRDEEAVLGSLDKSSIQEVLSGEKYEALRAMHKDKRFDEISYCKDCDQLYDAPDSLVWTNVTGKAYGQSKILADIDYRSYTD